MSRVTLEGIGGAPTVQLDATQSRAVTDEIRRVRGSWLHRWINEFRAPRARSAPFKAEVRVVVHQGRSVERYELYNGTVIRREGERHHSQFYMGLLLLRWLYGPTP